MLGYTIALESVDPARNRFRVYRITVCRDLFGAPCVLCEWGRKGRRLRLRSEPLGSVDACIRRADTIIQRRKLRGYSEAA